ncbi:uncharacterized protein LOC125662774 [Ostrea edulis]|uniref:uncharacterized protein LOC125662774 n=1 Tax=Ostrea edulis TaxID=37623 RepID=UPI0024AF6437|nr:uncharacterized protein LOC125662774 [Ostrea edulis]
MPFHLRFFGANSKGIELIYQQYNIMFGNAVNLCFKVCKENWWCGALRKCADRPQLFQCDVVCQFNSLENRNYRHGDERCATFQVDPIGPNVAANRTVSLVRNRHFHVFHAEYATDTVTICPNNRLFFHTRFTVDPWIQINLGQSTDIAMVVIYNRQTKEGERFQNAQIEVAENNVWRPCGVYKGPGVNYQIIFVICNEDVRGDILQISVKTAPGARTAIHLCEVEVFNRV